MLGTVENITMLSVPRHTGCEHFQERARLFQKPPVAKSNPDTSEPGQASLHPPPSKHAEPVSEASAVDMQPAGKPLNDVFYLGGRKKMVL